MPVRSLKSSVMRWPTREQVHEAAVSWARNTVASRPGIDAIGYFGSYARGDWGVGSDLDLVVIGEVGGETVRAQSPGETVRAQSPDPVPSIEPGGEKPDWQLESLPVPAEVHFYTVEQWRALLRSDRRMGQVLASETVWLTGPPGV